MIHHKKKARLEVRGKAPLDLKTGFQKGKRKGKQAKNVSRKNQPQCPEEDGDDAWQDQPEPLAAASSNKPIRGRNEKVDSCAFSGIYI